MPSTASTRARLRLALLAAGLTAISGSSVHAATGWERLPDTVPTPRSSHVMAYDPIRQNSVVFGGIILGGIVVADTWVLDVSTWRQPETPVAPSRRMRASMAFDSISGTVIMFGGQSASVGGELGDTWSWNGSSWMQLHPAHSPSARVGAAMTEDPALGGILLHGGSGRGDTWHWDGSDWIELHIASPGPRTGAAMAADPERETVVLFSGADATTGHPLPDTWIWNGASWTRAVTSFSPAPRSYAAMAADPLGYLVLFGGMNTSFAELNDTALWNGANWQQILPSGNEPAARDSAKMVYDRSIGYPVLFGGQSYSPTTAFTYMDDSRIWNGSAWLRSGAGLAPPRRSSTTLAPTDSGDLVLFGGHDGYGDLGDTWTWRDGRWTEQEPSIAPTNRYLAQIGYDEATQQTVLFGGFSDGAALADTWIWKNDAWTPQIVATSPTPRYGGVMTTDPVTGHALLFGGAPLAGGYLNDTWLWNGANWVQLAPAHAPPGRYRPGLATDPIQEVSVLFGGFRPGGSTLYDDTWIWNGFDWQQATTPDAPSERYSASMAFDPSTASVLLFGGGTLSEAFADSWRWTPDGWSQVTSAVIPEGRFSAAIATDAGGVLMFGGSTKLQGGMRDTWRWHS